MSVHPRTPQTPPALYPPSPVASSTTLRPPSSSPPFASPPGTRIDPQTSSRSYVFYGECYWQRDRLSLSLPPLLFIFLFFPRFFTSLLLPPSVSTPPRGFSPFYPSSSSLFRKREESFPTLRVIRNRALLDLAASVFASTRLLHAFHLAILAKDETLLVERRLWTLVSFDRHASSLEYMQLYSLIGEESKRFLSWFMDGRIG